MNLDKVWLLTCVISKDEERHSSMWGLFHNLRDAKKFAQEECDLLDIVQENNWTKKIGWYKANRNYIRGMPPECNGAVWFTIERYPIQ